MVVMVIAFGTTLLLIAIFGFTISWYNDREMRQMRKEYLASLQNEYEDQELEELIFDIDVSQYQFITYHDTLQ
jgi:hypothetical protein